VESHLSQKRRDSSTPLRQAMGHPGSWWRGQTAGSSTSQDDPLADHPAAVGMTECESVAMRGLSRVLSNLLCEYGAFFCQGGDTIQIGAIVLTIKEKYFWLLCPFGVMQIDTIDI